MRSTMRWLGVPARIAGLAVLLALAAGACGGSDGGSRVATLGGSSPASQASGGSGGSSDPEQAALDYARCMRQHGVDMPDPQFDANGKMRITVSGREGDKRKLDAAQSACGHLLKGGLGAGKQLDPADQDALLRFARCMREHGIDMPDPDPNQPGVLIRNRSIDPDSAKLQDAQRACKRFLDQVGARSTS